MRYLFLGLLFNCLLQTFAFPMGRCYVPQCASSPYQFTWTNVSYGYIENNVKTMNVCLQMSQKTCVDQPDYNCCNQFTNYLEKIVISTLPSCENTIKNIWVDNVKKNGGIYFDLYTYSNITLAELRLTSLALVNPSIELPTICLQITEPCNSLTLFCNDIDNNCKIALFNPVLHDCCPTCLLDTQAQVQPVQAPQVPPPQVPQPVQAPAQPPQVPQAQQIIKFIVVKVLNQYANISYINEFLCSKLTQSIPDLIWVSTCKIYYISSTGIYYGATFIEPYDNYVKSYISSNMLLFELNANIFCQGTISTGFNTTTELRVLSNNCK